MNNNFPPYFEKDMFAKYCNIRFDELNDDYVICSVEITENTLNATGAVQGGLIFTLGDLCFSALANRLHPRTVTQFASISYLNPAVGKTLFAKAYEIDRTRHNALYNVTIYNDKDVTIATMQASGFIKEL